MMNRINFFDSFLLFFHNDSMTFQYRSHYYEKLVGGSWPLIMFFPVDGDADFDG